jgi:hypothetical protein
MGNHGRKNHRYPKSPAFLHDFYGARRGTPEFDTAKWLNARTGSKDPEHFVRSQSVDGYLDEIHSAGIDVAVVIGRDTPGRHRHLNGSGKNARVSTGHVDSP